MQSLKTIKCENDFFILKFKNNYTMRSGCGHSIRCNGCYEWFDAVRWQQCGDCGMKFCSRRCFIDTCYRCQKCGIEKHVCKFSGSGQRNVCRQCTGK